MVDNKKLESQRFSGYHSTEVIGSNNRGNTPVKYSTDKNGRRKPNPLSESETSPKNGGGVEVGLRGEDGEEKRDAEKEVTEVSTNDFRGQDLTCNHQKEVRYYTLGPLGDQIPVNDNRISEDTVSKKNAHHRPMLDNYGNQTFPGFAIGTDLNTTDNVGAGVFRNEDERLCYSGPTTRTELNKSFPLSELHIYVLACVENMMAGFPNLGFSSAQNYDFKNDFGHNGKIMDYQRMELLWKQNRCTNNSAKFSMGGTSNEPTEHEEETIEDTPDISHDARSKSEAVEHECDLNDISDKVLESDLDLKDASDKDDTVNEKNIPRDHTSDTVIEHKMAKVQFIENDGFFYVNEMELDDKRKEEELDQREVRTESILENFKEILKKSQGTDPLKLSKDDRNPSIDSGIASLEEALVIEDGLNHSGVTIESDDSDTDRDDSFVKQGLELDPQEMYMSIQDKGELRLREVCLPTGEIQGTLPKVKEEASATISDMKLVALGPGNTSALGKAKRKGYNVRRPYRTESQKSSGTLTPRQEYGESKSPGIGGRSLLSRSTESHENNFAPVPMGSPPKSSGPTSQRRAVQRPPGRPPGIEQSPCTSPPPLPPLTTAVVSLSSGKQTSGRSCTNGSRSAGREGASGSYGNQGSGPGNHGQQGGRGNRNNENNRNNKGNDGRERDRWDGPGRPPGRGAGGRGVQVPAGISNTINVSQKIPIHPLPPLTVHPPPGVPTPGPVSPRGRHPGSPPGNKPYRSSPPGGSSSGQSLQLSLHDRPASRRFTHANLYDMDVFIAIGMLKEKYQEGGEGGEEEGPSSGPSRDTIVAEVSLCFKILLILTQNQQRSSELCEVCNNLDLLVRHTNREAGGLESKVVFELLLMHIKQCLQRYSRSRNSGEAYNCELEFCQDLARDANTSSVKDLVNKLEQKQSQMLQFLQRVYFCGQLPPIPLTIQSLTTSIPGLRSGVDIYTPSPSPTQGNRIVPPDTPGQGSGLSFPLPSQDPDHPSGASSGDNRQLGEAATDSLDAQVSTPSIRPRHTTRPTLPKGGIISMQPGTLRPHLVTQQDLLSLPHTVERHPGRGLGQVRHGSPSELVALIRKWMEMREDFFQQRISVADLCGRTEGILLIKDLTILDNQYRIKHEWIMSSQLGSGTSGEVRLAIDKGACSFRFCVKKVMLAKFDANEIEIWSRLFHPNIAQLYGATRQGDVIYIFQEFVAGKSLEEYIREDSPWGMNSWQALVYLKQILQVLVYLRTMKTLHEDIKASNIVLRADSYDLVIIDFGLSQTVGPQGSILCEGVPPCTPTHLSPEKAAGRDYGFPSEVWAAMCTFVHMLSGSPPWIKRYADRVQTLNYVIVTCSPPLTDIPNNLPEDIRDVILRGWAVNPDVRMTAQELLNLSAIANIDDPGVDPDDDRFNVHLPPEDDVISGASGSRPSLPASDPEVEAEKERLRKELKQERANQTRADVASAEKELQEEEVTPSEREHEPNKTNPIPDLSIFEGEDEKESTEVEPTGKLHAVLSPEQVQYHPCGTDGHKVPQLPGPGELTHNEPTFPIYINGILVFPSMQPPHTNIIRRPSITDPHAGPQTMPAVPKRVSGLRDPQKRVSEELRNLIIEQAREENRTTGKHQDVLRMIQEVPQSDLAHFSMSSSSGSISGSLTSGVISKDWGGARPKSSNPAYRPEPDTNQEPLIPSFPSVIPSAHEPSYLPPPQGQQDKAHEVLLQQRQPQIQQNTPEQAPVSRPSVPVSAPALVQSPSSGAVRLSGTAQIMGPMGQGAIPGIRPYFMSHRLPQGMGYGGGFIPASGAAQPNIARGPPVPARPGPTLAPVPVIPVGQALLPTVLGDVISLSMSEIEPPDTATPPVMQVQEDQLPDLDVFMQSDPDTLEAEPNDSNDIDQAVSQLQQLKLSSSPAVQKSSVQNTAVSHAILPVFLDDFASPRPSLVHSVSQPPSGFSGHEPISIPGLHKSATEPARLLDRDHPENLPGRPRRNTPLAEEVEQEQARLQEDLIKDLACSSSGTSMNTMYWDILEQTHNSDERTFDSDIEVNYEEGESHELRLAELQTEEDADFSEDRQVVEFHRIPGSLEEGDTCICSVAVGPQSTWEDMVTTAAHAIHDDGFLEFYVTDIDRRLIRLDDQVPRNQGNQLLVLVAKVTIEENNADWKVFQGRIVSSRSFGGPMQGYF